MGYRVLLALVAAAWLTGLALFLRAPGTVDLTLPQRQAEPAQGYNLANWRHGPSVKASSYFRDPYDQHHPIFLLDGRDHPGTVEKWASAITDRAPWVEIRWRRPRQLSVIVVRHGGDVEGENDTLHHYTLSCLGKKTAGPSVEIKDNRAGVARHALPCADAIGIRLDAVPNAPGDIVRIYEIEAWGT